MTNPLLSVARASLQTMLLALSVAGCGSDPLGAGKGPLCASCEPSQGGESSDFPSGSEHPCMAVSRRVTLSESEAAQLAFVDLAALKARVEQDADVPLRWTPKAQEYSRVTGGYQSETQIDLRTRVVGYQHLALDLSLCDGTTCVAEGIEPVPQAACNEFLFLLLETSVRTDDGAIDTVVTGDVAQWTGSTETASNENELPSHGYVDLGAAQGTLRIETREHEAKRGYLTLQRVYQPNGVQGLIWPTLIFETETRTAYENPLQGDFVIGDATPFNHEPPQGGHD